MEASQVTTIATPRDLPTHPRFIRGSVARASRVRAARVPKPQACGCGRAVAFDLGKHEFFCIGCGAAETCVCVHSPFTSMVRPVQVA